MIGTGFPPGSTWELPKIVAVDADPASLRVPAPIRDGALLPEDDWILRDDSTGVYVKDEDRIGDALSPGASVTLTTRAHLGWV